MKLLWLLVLLFAGSAVAQTMTPSAIVFEGVPQSSQAELLKLSGLATGRVLSRDDIEAAMHRLDDSGLFAGISYTTSGGTLRFQLEPAATARLERAQYGNFVWFTQDELNAAVHQKLPLFDGNVPGDGDMDAKVQRALEAILKERGVQATVGSRGVAGGGREYNIVEPPVVVGELQIANVDFSSDVQLTRVRDRIVGSEYLEGVTARQVKSNLDETLKELGYPQERVDAVGHAEPKLEAGRIVVPLTGTAVPGARYTVGSVTLPTRAGAVTAKDYESEFQVRPGGVPAPSLAENTRARMVNVFQNRGFLDAACSMTSVRDDAAHTVSYAFSVVPGQVYRMRNLVFAGGMSAQQQSELTQAWKLKQGADYDGPLAEEALMTRPVATLCGGRPARKELVPDHATHEVDVSLSCAARR